MAGCCCSYYYCKMQKLDQQEVISNFMCHTARTINTDLPECAKRDTYAFQSSLLLRVPFDIGSKNVFILLYCIYDVSLVYY